MKQNKIVFSDVDGTLLNSDNQITPLTQKAIKILEEKEIPFVIVSARSPSGIYPILRQYDFKGAIVSYSGGLILDENNRVIFHKGMTKPDAKKIIEFIEKEHLDMSWCVYSMDEWIVKDKTDPRVLQEERAVKAWATEGTIDDITENEVNKILCICNPNQTLIIEEKLKNEFPGFSIARSSDILLEIMEKGINKAVAVKTLCSLWNIDLENAIAFGDNYNDVEMLEEVGCGILMGNAPEELKEKFSKSTEDHNHDGIYHALRKLNLI